MITRSDLEKAAEPFAAQVVDALLPSATRTKRSELEAARQERIRHLMNRERCSREVAEGKVPLIDDQRVESQAKGWLTTGVTIRLRSAIATLRQGDELEALRFIFLAMSTVTSTLGLDKMTAYLSKLDDDLLELRSLRSRAH